MSSAEMKEGAKTNQPAEKVAANEVRLENAAQLLENAQAALNELDQKTTPVAKLKPFELEDLVGQRGASRKVFDRSVAQCGPGFKDRIRPHAYALGGCAQSTSRFRGHARQTGW